MNYFSTIKCSVSALLLAIVFQLPTSAFANPNAQAAQQAAQQQAAIDKLKRMIAISAWARHCPQLNPFQLFILDQEISVTISQTGANMAQFEKMKSSLELAAWNVACDNQQYVDVAKQVRRYTQGQLDALLLASAEMAYEDCTWYEPNIYFRLFRDARIAKLNETAEGKAWIAELDAMKQMPGRLMGANCAGYGSKIPKNQWFETLWFYKQTYGKSSTLRSPLCWDPVPYAEGAKAANVTLKEHCVYRNEGGVERDGKSWIMHYQMLSSRVKEEGQWGRNPPFSIGYTTDKKLVVGIPNYRSISAVKVFDPSGALLAHEKTTSLVVDEGSREKETHWAYATLRTTGALGGEGRIRIVFMQQDEEKYASRVSVPMLRHGYELATLPAPADDLP